MAKPALAAMIASGHRKSMMPKSAKRFSDDIML
jgi:hypothetical protein